MEQADFTPENRAILDGFLNRDHPAGSVAVFDLDGTLLRNDTGEAVLYGMAHRGLFDFDALLDSPEAWAPFDQHREIPDPRPAIEAYLADSRTREDMAAAILRAYRLLVRCAGKRVAYPWAAFLLAGKTPDEVRALSAEVFAEETRMPLGTENLPGGACDDRPIEVARGLRPYRAMGRLVADLRHRDFDVWIITASNRWSAEVYAEQFVNIPAGRVIGMTPVVRDGRIQARLDPEIPPTFGDGKVEAIRRIIGKEPVLAAGDTINQADMLDTATDLALVILKCIDSKLRERIRQSGSKGKARWIVQPRFLDPPGEE